MGRSGSDIEVSVYALLDGQPPSGHYIQIEMAAPYDTPHPNSIDVHLYELARSDPLRDEIIADSTCGITNPDLLVYGRGDHTWHPGIPGLPPQPCVIPNIIISDSQPSSTYTVEFGPGVLHVSNADTDQDFSRLVANDAPGWNWNTNLLQMKLWGVVGAAGYGEDRGYFTYGGYDGMDMQQNYRQSVLYIGQEVIVASVPDVSATLPLQSMPDIAFIFSHGEPSTQISPPCQNCDGYVFHFPYWPTQPGVPLSTGSNAYFSPYMLKDACPVGSDTEWLILTACNSLNIGNYKKQWIKHGYDDWEYIIRTQQPKQTSIMTVCGFSEYTRSLPSMSNFLIKFCEYLNTLTSVQDTKHWDPTLAAYPQDIVVIAWMEAAIWYIENYTANTGGLMQHAAAVSVDDTWVLDDFGNWYAHDWKAKTYP